MKQGNATKETMRKLLNFLMTISTDELEFVVAATGMNTIQIDIKEHDSALEDDIDPSK